MRKLPTTIRTDAGTLTLTDEFTVTYRDGDGNVTDTPPVYTDVGAYPVTVILTSISGNYAPDEVTATVTVTPRPLKARTLDGHVVKTDKVGWYLRTNHSVALDTEGNYYSLVVPGGSLWSQLKRVLKGGR